MNPISTALAAGYSAQQILKHISKIMPNLNPKIAKATASGYAANQILDFLMNSDVKNSKGGKDEYQSSGVNLAKRKKYLEEKEKKLVKQGLKFGATAAGTALAGRALMGASNAAVRPSEIIQTGLPGSVGQLPQPQSRLGLPAPGPSAPSPPTSTPPMSTMPSTPQSQTSMAPNIAPIAPPIKSSAIQSLDKLGIAQNVKNMIKANNDSETIGKIISYVLKPEKKNELQQMIKSGEIESLEKLIEDYMVESRNQQPVQQPENAQPNLINRQIEQQNTPIEKPSMQETQPSNEIVEPDIQPLNEIMKPDIIEVGSQVITPDGDIGTIEHLPGKTAKIKTDSGSNVAKTDDLTPIPQNREEIENNYEKYINSLPPNLRSKAMNSLRYDPENGILAAEWHGLPDMYLYKDLDQELINQLISTGFLNRTSGGNIWGVWVEGEESIAGSGASRIVQDLKKRLGLKHYFGKLKNIYNINEPGQSAMREKEKIRQKQESERNREEKKRLKEEENAKNPKAKKPRKSS